MLKKTQKKKCCWVKKKPRFKAGLVCNNFGNDILSLF